MDYKMSFPDSVSAIIDLLVNIHAEQIVFREFIIYKICNGDDEKIDSITNDFEENLKQSRLHLRESLFAMYAKLPDDLKGL